LNDTIGDILIGRENDIDNWTILGAIVENGFADDVMKQFHRNRFCQVRRDDFTEFLVIQHFEAYKLETCLLVRALDNIFLNGNKPDTNKTCLCQDFVSDVFRQRPVRKLDGVGPVFRFNWLRMRLVHTWIAYILAPENGTVSNDAK